MKQMMYIVIAILIAAGCAVDVKTEFIRSVAGYSDYSTVDWDFLGDKFYRPDTADWPAEVDSLIIEGFPMEIACGYWHLLQNARTDFHQKSLPLRENASENIVATLNNTEAMFDTVFVRCVSQEYYMRLFAEMYNETMRPALDELAEKLNNNNKTLTQ
jgi:hypothetical protein